MQRRIVRGLVIAGLASLLGSPSEGANFSCSFGRGACLGYGDTVCSSMGKCVSNDAVCFNSYTCNYQGFACKSDVDKIANAYDELLMKSKRLSTAYDDLVNDNDDLVVKFNSLLSDHDALARKHRSSRDCVERATSLEDAHACF